MRRPVNNVRRNNGGIVGSIVFFAVLCSGYIANIKQIKYHRAMTFSGDLNAKHPV